MKKAITIIGIMVTTCAFATDDGREITTSQRYVETQLRNRQDTIPAKNGDKVVTPTSTKGTIGERDIKTTLGDETTNQNDTGITTVETVNTAADAKQVKLKPYGGVNVVTYTGTNDDSSATNGKYGVGVTAATPIYDENVNTYGNGLVRAETLNTAVQRGVSRALTRVPAGFLINTIGDVLPTTISITAVDVPKSCCFKRIDSSAIVDSSGSCSNTMFNAFARGDWGMVYNRETGISYPGDTCTGVNCYKEVRGISACSDQTFTGYGYGIVAPASLSSALQNAYENSKDGSTPPGRFCYCRLVEPHIGVGASVSPWIFRYASFASASICAKSCAEYCGYTIYEQQHLRNVIFGGVDPTQATAGE